MTTSPSKSVTVVLVHGAWADGSSWRRVIPYLQKAGIRVIAVQNPTSSLRADVDATRQALATVTGPVVLVGHSWGGTVITEAGNDPKVKALVYVAALAPDAGQSTGDQVASHGAPPALAEAKDDGTGALKMSVAGWINGLAHDLLEDEARVFAAVQPPLPTSTFADKITQAAWANRPTWYVVSTEDRAVTPALQRELAQKMKARTTEVKASHMSLMSVPQIVGDVIRQAVAEVPS